MRILVTFAVEAEFAPWAKLRRFDLKTLAADHWSGGFKAYEAKIGENTVWAHFTGIGPLRKGLFPFPICAKAAGTDFVISSGLAGSLRKEHSVGQVIAPRRIGTLRDAMGIPANDRLLRLAEEHGAKLVGALLTSDRLIETGEEKNRLAHFADAVDMESSQIMQEFASESVPAVTIRAISDDSDEDLPVDFGECLTTEGKVKPLPLMKQLLKSPSKFPELVRFGVKSKKAAERMATFLDSFVEALASQNANNEAGVEV